MIAEYFPTYGDGRDQVDVALYRHVCLFQSEIGNHLERGTLGVKGGKVWGREGIYTGWEGPRYISMRSGFPLLYYTAE